MQSIPTKSAAGEAPLTATLGQGHDTVSASIPDTLAALKVDPETGLTRAEVDTRRKQHGYNEVAEQKGHPILRFLGKFWGLSAWMLELIMVLSLSCGKYSDLAVVGALLVVNAVLGFAQEHRAAGVVETLRRRLQVSARVRRDASWQVVPARELVPGDIVRVRPGDIIPADVKLLTGALSVDQSALTGESKDVEKAPGDVLSSGSVVRRGEGNGVVMLTGAQTYFGRTTELVQAGAPETAHRSGGGQGGALAVRHRRRAAGRGGGDVADPRRAARRDGSAHARPVDERGAGRAARHVHGQHGLRIEGAGQARRAGHTPQRRRGCRHDGRALRGQDGHDHDEPAGRHRRDSARSSATEADVLFAGALASQEANQDPIDLAFLAAAKERHVFDGVPAVTPVSFAPFDAKSRRTEAVVEQNGQRLRVMKGAVRTVAEACGLQPPAIEALEARVSDSALKGYRTLAVARGPETGAPALVGLVTLVRSAATGCRSNSSPRFATSASR